MKSKFFLVLLVVVMFLGCSLCMYPFDEPFNIDSLQYCEIPEEYSSKMLHEYEFPQEFKDLPIVLDEVELQFDIKRPIDRHNYSTVMKLWVYDENKENEEKIIDEIIPKDLETITIKKVSENFKNALNNKQSKIYIKVQIDDQDFDIDEELKNAVAPQPIGLGMQAEDFFNGISSTMDITVNVKGKINIIDAAVKLSEYLEDGKLKETPQEDE